MIRQRLSVGVTVTNMLPTPQEMQEIESAAFARGCEAETLMERAGLGMTRVIRSFFPEPQSLTVVCGKGHNAGDVLVVARQLVMVGWSAELDMAFPEAELAPLTAKKLAELKAGISLHSATATNFRRRVVLDGLLGIGSCGVPRDPVHGAIKRIQSLRMDQDAFVFSADVPSGLDAHSGVPAETCVEADCTLTVAYPKVGLLADAATNYVGRLAVIPVPELASDNAVDQAIVLTPSVLRRCLPPRSFDSHKGTWGRVGVIAGSSRYPGAARLCSAAAVAGGAGLVTLYVLPGDAEVFSVACIPEVMVKTVDSYEAALQDPLDVLAIGPGLGDKNDAVIRNIIYDAQIPCVVDADALNALSKEAWSERGFCAPRLFTPHPVEMNRLVPGSLGQNRRSVAEAFAAANPNVTLLLKGARTILASHGEPVRFNTTGNPGMGTGGMGDVLTGVSAALMARSLSPIDAGSVAAWTCGRAAEEFIFRSSGSPESLTASAVVQHLGAAFQAIGAED
jgi:NAD(P)H-hydrate epimerase